MGRTHSAEHATHLVCSFCGKDKTQVGQLIAGPGCYICDTCVALCDEILAADSAEPIRNWDNLGDDDLLAEMVRIHASHQQIDRTVGAVVQKLRLRGVSWARIGEGLGMTRQSAWERFSGEE